MNQNLLWLRFRVQRNLAGSQDFGALNTPEN